MAVTKKQTKQEQKTASVAENVVEKLGSFWIAGGNVLFSIVATIIQT